MKQEQQELGRLKVEFPIQTRRILSLHIVEESNTHASLELVLVLKQPVPLEEAQRCEDAAVKAASPSGPVFCGIAAKVGVRVEAGYAELSIKARSQSIQTDRKKRCRTFQDP